VRGRLTQRLECYPHTVEVTGSNPVAPTRLKALSEHILSVPILCRMVRSRSVFISVLTEIRTVQERTNGQENTILLPTQSQQSSRRPDRWPRFLSRSLRHEKEPRRIRPRHRGMARQRTLPASLDRWADHQRDAPEVLAVGEGSLQRSGWAGHGRAGEHQVRC